MINTAVEGTRAVLSACLKHDVKRLVFTSCISNVIFKRAGDSQEIYSDGDWSEEELLGPYEKSKFLAEKVLNDFKTTFKSYISFETVSIVAGVAVGPSLTEHTSCNEEYLR